MANRSEASIGRLRKLPGPALALIALLTLGSLVPQAAAQTPAAKTPSTPAVVDPPLVEPAGYQGVLAKYRGKPLVVNFWATWCEPCREEYPMLVELAKQYKSAGLAVVGVSFDDNAEMNLVRRFLARNKPGFPNYRLKPGNDAEFIRAVSPSWNGAIPTTMFYTSDGRILGTFIGTRPRAEFGKAIQELLRASPPGPGGAAPHARNH